MVKASFMKIAALFLVLLFGLAQISSAQGTYFRPIISLQYNTLTNSSHTVMATTPRAMGSGLYDFSQKIGLSHLIPIKKNKLMVEVDFPLINITKYRFTKNIYFSNNQVVIDTNSNHIYHNSFFSRTGSKMTLIGLQIPAYIVFILPKIKNSYIKIGLYGEYRFMGWHKLIFYQDKALRIIHTDFHKLQNQGINPFGWGFSTGLKIKNIYIFADYSANSLTNFNKALHQLSYGVYYFLSLNSLKKKIKRKTKLVNYGQY